MSDQPQTTITYPRPRWWEISIFNVMVLISGIVIGAMLMGWFTHPLSTEDLEKVWEKCGD